jgi:Asp-tRNA(Asn)/Glu-tRNA(Gln) amidotransferase A subunit family amidase
MQAYELRRPALRRATLAGLVSVLLSPAMADAEGRKPGIPPGPAFPLREATIDGIHKAIQTGRITCTGLVQLYLNRIEAYSGQCTAYLDEEGNPKPPDLFMPSGKGLELGELTAIPNAGQVNAFQNLNLRGRRSETDLVDDDPAMPDALEVAARLDAEFAASGELSGPLHCIPIGVKDQMDTFDMRTTDGAVADYADDRPPQDATLVARLRGAGAIILGKTNMGEYASGSRSTYQGQTCNPYATDRAPGGSSSGSAAAVAANLVVCSIAEESLGSIRNPADSQGIVGFAPTRGLVPRTGNYRANLIRERYGPHCRTSRDAAKILDAIAGYDPGDPITALSVGEIPKRGYAAHTGARSLEGKRLGVVREFMTRFSVVDEDGIRVANEAIEAMRAAGAEIVESVNPRDCALFGECGDPSIPDMSPSIQDAIEELLPTLEPSFVGEAAASDAWPGANRLIPSFLPPAPFARFIDWAVGVFFDRSLFPSSPSETDPTKIVNLRRLNATPSGAFRQGLYGFNRYLTGRGDANILTVADLREFVTPCGQAEFESGGCGKGRVQVVGESPPSDTGTTLDTPGEAGHLFRQQALREIVLHVMAANDLDALVYPHSVIPPGPQNVAGAGNPRTIENRGSVNAFTDVSGLPDVVVPAGFTEVVYDAVDCATPGAFPDEGAPTGQCLLKRDLRLPFGMCFHGRPFSEPVLFEITSAFERAIGPRQPPPGFGPLAGEL